jgi:TonB family protein
LFLSIALLAQPAGSSISLVRVKGTKITLENGTLRLRPGPGWVATAVPFSDSVIAFDVQAASNDFDADLVVRAALAEDKASLAGYHFALPSPNVPNRDQWMRAPAKGVKVIEEHPMAIAADGAWHRVSVTANGSRLALTIDGAMAGDYEVTELGGVFAFTARHGLGYVKNIDIQARVATDVASPMPVDEIEKAGGRAPRLLRDSRPQYSSGAMRAKAQGVVKVRATVQTDGSVTDVKVIRKLHPDLDANGIATVRQWKFSPAVLNGRLVQAIVEIELEYKLR